MNAIEIAKHLLCEVGKQTGKKLNYDQMIEAVAKTCAREFPHTDESLLRDAITIANRMLKADEHYKLRKIEPISITGLDIATPENGQPICELVRPESLYVDPSYQRQIGARGLAQIRKIVEAFDWNKFKPPICAYAEHDGETVLKVLDGQHTCIAAASHPEIVFIPVMICDAPVTWSQAAAFVGQNTERLAVTPLQIHQSSLIAHDLDAITIDEICKHAGVTILRSPGPSGKTKPGETVSITAITEMINKRGNEMSQKILTVLAQAGFAPILKPQIRAVDLLMTHEEYRDHVTPEALVGAMKGSWIIDLDEAKKLAVTHKLPVWRALAIAWFRKAKKNRGALARVA